MKKLLVLLAVAAIGFGFASCKKECKCSMGGISVDMSKYGDIDTKEKCTDLEKGTEGTPIKCEWK